MTTSFGDDSVATFGKLLEVFLQPKRNDRQKIELNVEILESHLGCMKSTHSMNAATWGR
jgi:hypothetical protein